MKYSFCNDYSELVHPRILKQLEKFSNEQNIGYGYDYHSVNAENLIKKSFNVPNSDVYFVSGGTQANLLVISHILKDYQAVLACDTGHINVHETGAIEASGHKIVTCLNQNGKLTSFDILNVLKNHTSCHSVEIKMVYISNSTENGLVYTKKELLELYKTCKANNLYLFIDGARLSSALTSKDNDLTKEEFASLCDVFYIGGTKIGLLFGEAIVINNNQIKEGFKYHLKTRGALLAKGFVNGIQFEEMFKDDLYFQLGKVENKLAYYLSDKLEKLGIEFNFKVSTNQIFIEIDNSVYNSLIKDYLFEIWEDKGNSKIIRLVISWFTKIEVIDEFIQDLNKLVNK